MCTTKQEYIKEFVLGTYGTCHSNFRTEENKMKTNEIISKKEFIKLMERYRFAIHESNRLKNNSDLELRYIFTSHDKKIHINVFIYENRILFGIYKQNENIDFIESRNGGFYFSEYEYINNTCPLEENALNILLEKLEEIVKIENESKQKSENFKTTKCMLSDEVIQAIHEQYKKEIDNHKKELKRHKTFLKMAKELSTLSHCVSFQVGCLFVRDNRIIASGINGTPTSSKNCSDVFDKNNFDREKHHQFSKRYEVHAEQNVFLMSNREGISLKDSIAYLTLSPCFDCAKMLAQLPVKAIYYIDEYDKSMNSEKNLKEYFEEFKIIYEQIDLEEK